MRATGTWGLAQARYARALHRHLVSALATIGRPEGYGLVRRTALDQIYFTGVGAIPVVAALALLLGGVISVQALSLLSGTGNEDFLGNLMQLVVFRELGPLMTAFIVIGRSGSAITVELGNMSVHRELDLLVTMGVDPARLLVLPRLVGVVAATTCLCLLFDTIAVLGGLVVARVALDVHLVAFLHIVGGHLTVPDLLLSLLKTVVFGAVIATVSTWHGMNVGRVVTEVPVATSRAVVHSLVLCLVVDTLLTVAFYAGYQP